METLKVLTRFELPITAAYINDLVSHLSCGLETSDIIGAATVAAYVDHSPFGKLSDLDLLDAPTSLKEYLALWEATLFSNHVPNDSLDMVIDDVSVIFFMFYSKLTSIFKGIVVPPQLKGRNVREFKVSLRDDGNEYTDLIIEAKLDDRSIDDGKVSIRKGAHAPDRRIKQTVPYTHVRETPSMPGLRHRVPNRTRRHLRGDFKRPRLSITKR